MSPQYAMSWVRVMCWHVSRTGLSPPAKSRPTRTSKMGGRWETGGTVLAKRVIKFQKYPRLAYVGCRSKFHQTPTQMPPPIFIFDQVLVESRAAAEINKFEIFICFVLFCPDPAVFRPPPHPACTRKVCEVHQVLYNYATIG